MTTHAEAADVLDDAADHIERHGWWGGGEYEPKTACAVLAISEVTKGGMTHLETCRSLAASLSLKIGEDDYGVAELVFWNDAPERTKQEVLDAFRAAAKAERRLDDAS